MLNAVNAECSVCFIDMMSAVMPSVVILNVIMLNVIMLNVIMLNVIMLNVIMLSVVALLGKATLWVPFGTTYHLADTQLSNFSKTDRVLYRNCLQ